MSFYKLNFLQRGLGNEETEKGQGEIKQIPAPLCCRKMPQQAFLHDLQACAKHSLMPQVMSAWLNSQLGLLLQSHQNTVTKGQQAGMTEQQPGATWLLIPTGVATG